MKAQQSLDIRASSYDSRLEKLSDDMVKFTRLHRFESEGREIDVFGPLWSFAIGHIQKGQVGVVVRGRPIFCSGCFGAFIPPFSIVEWCFRRGSHRFEATLSSAKLPEGMPAEPVYFPLKPNAFPQSLAAITEIIRMARDTKAFGKMDKKTSVARRTKAFLDGHVSVDIALSEVARQLNYSPSVMARAFIRAYGITAVNYRNRLKVMESLRLMLLEDVAVGDAFTEAGFGAQSRFNQHFRDYTLLPPSKFGRKVTDH